MNLFKNFTHYRSYFHAVGGSTLAYVKCLEAGGRWCNLFKFLFYCCSVYRATSSRLSTFEFGVILVIILIYIAVSIV